MHVAYRDLRCDLQGNYPNDGGNTHALECGLHINLGEMRNKTQK